MHAGSLQFTKRARHADRCKGRLYLCAAAAAAEALCKLDADEEMLARLRHAITPDTPRGAFTLAFRV
jgi:hypothetical protein